MLALTRKKGESLVVNNNIEITVLEISILLFTTRDSPFFRGK